MNEFDEHAFRNGFYAAVSFVWKLSPNCKAAKELTKPEWADKAVDQHDRKLGVIKNG